MFRNLKAAGEVTTTVGLGATFIMAAVGTIAIDLVILAIIAKESDRRSVRNHGGGNNDIFITLLLLNMMSNRRTPTEMLILLIASPFLTAIAVALSFAAGVPEVGIALILGWGISLGLVALGQTMIALADMGIDYFKPSISDDVPPTYVEPTAPSYSAYGFYSSTTVPTAMPVDPEPNYYTKTL